MSTINEWQDFPVIKRKDNTFIVYNMGMPYHVVNKEIDPNNLFDLQTITEFWDSLLDKDSRKQTEPPPLPDPVDTRTPEEKRTDAYRFITDPIMQSAMGYRAEAEALRLEGNEKAAKKVDVKADELLRELLVKKDEIRKMYPDEK